MAYVEKQAELTRSGSDKNAAKFFLDALHKNWKTPVKIAKKAKQAKQQPEEKPSVPPANFSAELAWWQSASEAQREDILGDPRFEIYRKSMRKGVTAASLGLPVLREVLAELAQKAGSAATALVGAQQPQQEAA